MEQQGHTSSGNRGEFQQLQKRLVTIMNKLQKASKKSRHCVNQISGCLYSFYITLNLEQQNFNAKLFDENISKLENQINQLCKSHYYYEFSGQLDQNVRNNLKEISNITQVMHNLLVTKKEDQKSFVYEYNEGLLNELQKAINNGIQKLQKLSKRSQKVIEKAKQEYSFLIWLDDVVISLEGDIATQYHISNSLKQLLQTVEGIQINSAQTLKIFSALEPGGNNSINVEMCDVFFKDVWGVQANRAVLLDDNLEYNAALFQTREVLVLTCKELDANDMDNHELLDKKWTITRSGFNNSGITLFGRQGKKFTNDIAFKGDNMISRRQMQIIYKEKHGFCLVCTSTTNPCHLSLIYGEERPLFKDCVVEINNVFKVIVTDIRTEKRPPKNPRILDNQQEEQKKQQLDDDDEEQGTIKRLNFSKSLIQSNLKSQQKFAQKQQNNKQDNDDDDSDDENTIQRAIGKTVNPPQQQQQKQPIPEMLNEDDEDATIASVGNQQPRISFQISCHQLIAQENQHYIKQNNVVFTQQGQQRFYIGSDHIKDGQIEKQCLEIFYENRQWKVKCVQQKKEKYDICYWLKTNKQNNEFDNSQPSQAFQLTNGDIFGVKHDVRKYIFQAHIVDQIPQEPIDIEGGAKDSDETEVRKPRPQQGRRR